MLKRSRRRAALSAGGLALAAALAGGFGEAQPAGAAALMPAVSSAPAAASGTYVPPSQPLHYGETGAAVKSVQRRLAQLHYYPGRADGVYGPDTQEAAWAFREVQGLRVGPSSEAEPITRAFEKALVNPRQPRVLIRNGPKNRVEINQSIQVLVLYKNGKPTLIAHTSTGGGYYYPCPGDPNATCGPAIMPDGNYHALWFYPGWMTVPLGTMYNPVFFIDSAYAIHGDIPVPWYPVSHGCVRLWMDVAPWFHKHLSIGGKHPTPIYIRGYAPPYPDSN
jgi:peptidoglycan hydrolase-like protein with peptidoglycan-binding domain